MHFYASHQLKAGTNAGQTGTTLSTICFLIFTFPEEKKHMEGLVMDIDWMFTVANTECALHPHSYTLQVVL